MAGSDHDVFHALQQLCWKCPPPPVATTVSYQFPVRFKVTTTSDLYRYSFVLQSLVGCVYAFGFILMCPQLYLNYKLQSVAHLPWCDPSCSICTIQKA